MENLREGIARQGAPRAALWLGALLLSTCNRTPASLDECLLQANEREDAEGLRLAQENCREVFRWDAEARANAAQKVDPLRKVGGYFVVGPQRCASLHWGEPCYKKKCLCYDNRYAEGMLLCDKERGGPTRVFKVEAGTDHVILTPEDGTAKILVYRSEVDCLRASATAE